MDKKSDFMNKKNLISIATIIIVAVIVILIVAFTGGDNNDTNTTTVATYLISEEGILPQANIDAGLLAGKIIVIESKYCGYCKKFKEETLNPIMAETNLEITFYDLSESDQRAEVENMGLNVVGTPTFIVDGYAYIGYTDKETFYQILKDRDISFILTEI